MKNMGLRLFMHFLKSKHSCSILSYVRTGLSKIVYVNEYWTLPKWHVSFRADIMDHFYFCKSWEWPFILMKVGGSSSNLCPNSPGNYYLLNLITRVIRTTLKLFSTSILLFPFVCFLSFSLFSFFLSFFFSFFCS